MLARIISLCLYSLHVCKEQRHLALLLFHVIITYILNRVVPVGRFLFGEILTDFYIQI